MGLARETEKKVSSDRQRGMEKEGAVGAGRREPWPAPRKKLLTLYFYPRLVVNLLPSLWKQYFVKTQF